MGSLCSSITGAFAPSQQTTGATTGTQSGQSQSAQNTAQTGTSSQTAANTGATTGLTQSALAPFLQSYAQQVAGQYTPAGIATTAGQLGPNGFQTGAANTAAGIAQTGIDPASISRYLSPALAAQVTAAQNQFNLSNKIDQQNNTAKEAAQGALGNSNNAVQRALTQQAEQTAQAPVIANLYNSAYGQAAGLSTADVNARLAAAQAEGAQGSNIYGATTQQALTPYSLTNQGQAALSGLASVAGGTTAGTTLGQSGIQGATTANSNTTGQNNFTGQTAGTSNQNIVQQPSIGSILAGLAGTALSSFGKPAAAKDGGAVKPHFSHGGAVADKAPGDPNGSMLEKVVHATHHLRKLKNGGTPDLSPMRPRFDFGGDVPVGDSWNAPSPTGSENTIGNIDQGVGDPNGWGATVTTAPQGPSFTDKLATGLTGLSKLGAWNGSFNGASQHSAQANDPYGLTALGTSLRAITPHFDGGGSVDPNAPTWVDGVPQFSDDTATAAPSYVGASDAESTPSASSSWLGGLGDSIGKTLGSIPKPFSNGVWVGDAATPSQRFGAALTQIGSGFNGAPGPFAGFGKSILAQQELRYKELEAERAAGALLGQFRGQPTIEAQTLALAKARNPAEIAHLNAQTGLASAQATAAGLVPQLQLKGAELAQQQYLKRAQDLFYLRMVKDNPGNPNRAEDVKNIEEQMQANEQLGRQLKSQALATGSAAAAALPAAPMPTSSTAASGAPISVRAADGVVRQFPAGTPKELIEQTMRKEWDQRHAAPDTAIPGIAVQ